MGVVRVLLHGDQLGAGCDLAFQLLGHELRDLVVAAYYVVHLVGWAEDA